MTEIILSFFAIIGIVLIAIYICDYFFYRKYKECLPLLVDLKGKSELESIEILELIATVRQRKSGKAAISELMILTDNTSEIKRDDIYRYLKIFGIPGTIYNNVEIVFKKN